VPPIPDPVSPPIENPGTDPDVIEPGKARTPMWVHGAMRSLEGPVEQLGGCVNPDCITPGASANDLSPQNRRTHMASIKPVEASQDFTADLAALRDDVAKLSSSLSEFIRTQTTTTTNTVVDAVANARQKIFDTASKAQDRVARTGTDLETTIERNPLVAVLIAMVAGIFVGMVAGIGLLSRGRK
jgi:ElaB/YqjD/DUF883 family membrane-anchored ribosome-binding protein